MQSTNQDYNAEELIQLLQEDSALESNGPEDRLSTRSRRDLKSRYNSLVEENPQVPRFPDPLQYLPPEMWMHLLQQVAEDDCADILPLTLVCQRWSSIILSIPRLWTSIYIRADLDALEVAHLALFLSKGLLLCMTVDVPIAPDVQKMIIEREVTRVKHLKLKVLPGYSPGQNWESNDPLDNSIGSFFKYLGPLPSLESLTIDIGDISCPVLSSPLRFLDAPNLRYLTPSSSPGDVSELSRFTRLRYLRTISPMETVIPELVKLTELKDLVLSGSTLKERGMPPRLYTESCKSIAPLENLQSYWEPWIYIQPLLFSVRSSVRVLELKIGWEQVFELLTAIDEAPFLHQLSINVYISVDSSGKVEDAGWKAPTLPQIHEFRLKVVQVHSGSQKATRPRILLDALDGSLTNVRRLYFYFDVFASDLVRFLKGVEQLNTLTTDGSVQHDRARTISCPSLKILTTRTEQVLRYVSMPNLISLTIWNRSDPDELITDVPYPEIDRGFVTSVQSLHLGPELAEIIDWTDIKFTQLVTLKWLNRDGWYCYPRCSFSFLTKIIFDEKYGSVGATYFFQLLLRYPRTGPSLETIAIHGYPEWDVLLYMLLRRNIYHNITRITSIELPGYPAPYILGPLSALLLGRIPLEMPSLKELSFIDIRFNLDMCADCVHCRLTCSTPVPLHQRSHMLALYSAFRNGITNMMPRGSDPLLPGHLQDWFDSWEERGHAWTQELIKRRYRRVAGVEIDSKEMEYPLSPADDDHLGYETPSESD
ncbi:4993_t:CDS:2 [Acaulospora colombiana]|uniref:4993_t:CDS:1 n=1 Tax=Acaulospora colombiana TaxID=27376 RepID=A0ACA9KRM5_9GLOM|nr:4993_t:CDS:2 [Acaulospora colombiana]